MLQIKPHKFKHLGWLCNFIVLILSLAPIGKHVPQPVPGSDLIYHAIAYAGLCFLFLKGYSRTILMVLFLLSLQGVLVEIIQPYTGRYFEWWDMLANTVGVLIGLGVYSISKEPDSNKSTSPSK